MVRCWTPRISLIAIMPARPPEMAMVTMMMVLTGMPAYSAALVLWPVARMA